MGKTLLDMGILAEEVFLADADFVEQFLALQKQQLFIVPADEIMEIAGKFLYVFLNLQLLGR